MGICFSLTFQVSLLNPPAPPIQRKLSSWLSHYADDLRGAVGLSFENSSPDRDFFYVGAGAVLALPSGFQPYVNFRALVGHSCCDNCAGSIGVRMEL